MPRRERLLGRRSSVTAQSSEPASSPSDGAAPSRVPPDPQTRPWRTEGLPKGQPPTRARRWLRPAMWFLAYLVLFAVLTMQDRWSGPQAIPYTEFKAQVANKNVAELFARGDSIEGQLKTPVAIS